MLYFSRWKATATVLVALLFCLFAIPSFFPRETVETWPSFASRQLVLGLDLQGGSHLLLEVDTAAVRREKANQLADDVRRTLRDARIRFTGGVVIRGDNVEVRIADANDVPNALAKLRELSQPLGGFLGTTGQVSTSVTDVGNGLIRLTTTPPAITERIRQSVEQSMEIISRRINELGLVEPIIQRQGLDRIVVQAPGLQDPTRLKELLGRTAKLEFRLVDLTVSPEQAAAGNVPLESQVLLDRDSGQPIVVENRVMVAGGELTDAQPGFDQRNGQPIVSFRFNTSGARKFAQTTSENVGRPFAIVLDNEVISAPVINEPITQGAGQISGSFTVQQANDLAILLRAGALPAPLTIVEERTVGPGLGQDSINAGTMASYIGSIGVIIFMILVYRLFGVFANIAVLINVAMIFGILSMLGATLTLPGIAGIVLTVGIAVDSNVLIYERIREEARTGRSAINAIEAGFRLALATILDSNITTFIAAAVLFFAGTGAVRGFAVTLGLGIITTVFTAFTVTRLIVSWWVRWRRPQTVPI